MDLTPLFLRNVREASLLPRGARILVAASGGGDSVALLQLLGSAADVRELTVEVASVDHHTRPGSTDDVRFVGDLCRALGLPFHALELPPEAGALGEDGLRRARREALQAAAAANGAAVIALGHQADDVAETMIMRLLRGAGLDGLAGIRARSGPFIRPLLDFRREELRAHLRFHALRWVEDPTNLDVRRLRARVRHRILPALRAARPDIDRSLVAAARAAAGVLEPLERWEAGWMMRHAAKREGGLDLPVGMLRGEPRASQGRLARRAAECLGVDRSSLGRACVEEILAAVSRDGSTAVVPLPGALEARRDGTVLRIAKRE
jgi:tRNA(Ile)-lysidine synthase